MVFDILNRKSDRKYHSTDIAPYIIKPHPYFKSDTTTKIKKRKKLFFNLTKNY